MCGLGRFSFAVYPKQGSQICSKIPRQLHCDGFASDVIVKTTDFQLQYQIGQNEADNNILHCTGFKTGN